MIDQRLMVCYFGAENMVLKQNNSTGLASQRWCHHFKDSVCYIHYIPVGKGVLSIYVHVPVLEK